MDLNLRTILIMVMAITSLSVIYNTILAQAVLIGVALVLLLSINPSKHRFQRIWHRLKLILRIVITLMIFQVLFRREGDVLWQWQFVQITSGGLEYGIAASLRFMLIVIIAGLLFDIPYYDYLLAFRAWKFPYEISFLVATVIHFIPIFGRQFQRSREALFLRGIELSKLPLLTRSKAFISLIFPVVARAISEVRYRAISLELRAFRLYPTRTYLYEQKLKWWDWVVQVGVVGVFALVLSF
ncbi:MAG: energy-coupling factor transporter transmembrane component T [Candidatus Cloacimonadales bacterium]|nr:energy-coupling factor transporter transmembrane component T [Candidatus Cloacimonadales bacterium]